MTATSCWLAQSPSESRQGPLLALVHSHLGEASHPKTRTKVVALLHHAGRGFAANPSAGPQDLMVFVHSVLEPGLAAEEAARQLAQAEATTALPAARGELLCGLSHVQCVCGCIQGPGDDAMHICLEQASAVGSLKKGHPSRQESRTSNLSALHTRGRLQLCKISSLHVACSWLLPHCADLQARQQLPMTQQSRN